MSIEKSTKDFRSTNYCTWLCSLITMMGFKARSGRPVTPGVGCTDTVLDPTTRGDSGAAHGISPVYGHLRRLLTAWIQ
jgi:hypothetical protein